MRRISPHACFPVRTKTKTPFGTRNAAGDNLMKLGAPPPVSRSQALSVAAFLAGTVLFCLLALLATR